MSLITTNPSIDKSKRHLPNLQLVQDTFPIKTSAPMNHCHYRGPKLNSIKESENRDFEMSDSDDDFIIPYFIGQDKSTLTTLDDDHFRSPSTSPDSSFTNAAFRFICDKGETMFILLEHGFIQLKEITRRFIVEMLVPRRVTFINTEYDNVFLRYGATAVNSVMGLVWNPLLSSPKLLVATILVQHFLFSRISGDVDIYTIIMSLFNGKTLELE